MPIRAQVPVKELIGVNPNPGFINICSREHHLAFDNGRNSDADRAIPLRLIHDFSNRGGYRLWCGGLRGRNLYPVAHKLPRVEINDSTFDAAAAHVNTEGSVHAHNLTEVHNGWYD